MIAENLYNAGSLFKKRFQSALFSGKLNNPAGYLALAGLGLGLGILITQLGLNISIIALGGILGIPVVFICMFNQQFGVAFMLLVAFFVQFIAKYNDAPIGTSLDALLLISCFGILIRQILHKNWSFAKDPTSNWLLAWVYFNIFQVLNPAAESKLAWMYTVRSVAVLNILYFVACYAFNSLDRIKFMLKWVLGLASITALYAMKQEFIGFSAAEKSWLYADPERFQLFFQWGRMRIFSLFNDPMTFGVMMTYMGIFCFIMATAPMVWWKKFLLIVMGIIMLWTTALTGTRTCYILIPIGFVYFAMMTLTRNVLIGIAVFTVLGSVLILKSTSNPMIYRIQSAFRPSEDPSVLIRYYNQKRIRPYIYSHPIGSGLGSTGLWARRFTPDSFLAKFAHDSYYVRLAVEVGWIGLALYMMFLFTAIRRGIYYYVRVKDPTIKKLYLALITSLFILAVANYPQEAIDQLPTSLVVYIFIAAVVRLKDFDPYYQSISPTLRA